VNEVGFSIVEFAGSFTTADIPKIKATFDELGMRAVSQHASMNQASIDTALALGMPYTGIGSIPSGNTTSQWKTTADNFNVFGQQAAAKGLKFAPHMHSELWTPVVDAPGTIGMDVMLANTDPNLVFFEMDIYWAYVGVWENGFGTSIDPVDYLEAYPKRFPLFHVKDGVPANNVDGYSMVPAGTGVIPLQKLLDAVGEKGFRHPNYEQDNAPGGSAAPNQSLQASQLSYTNIASWREKEDD
jgi:sugar phosphate isomerase/epimerase